MNHFTYKNFADKIQLSNYHCYNVCNFFAILVCSIGYFYAVQLIRCKKNILKFEKSIRMDYYRVNSWKRKHAAIEFRGKKEKYIDCRLFLNKIQISLVMLLFKNKLRTLFLSVANNKIGKVILVIKVSSAKVSHAYMHIPCLFILSPTYV